MKIYSGIRDVRIDSPTVISIGKFDGVHKGHQYILSQMSAEKERLKAELEGGNEPLSVVFTFDPAPARVLYGISESELTTRDEKRALFEKLGVDVLVEFPLNNETLDINAESFVKDILRDGMSMKAIVAGTDLSFGRFGRGNAEMINTLGKELGFSVKIMDKVSLGGAAIGSTRIREAIECADFKSSKKMLGRNYSVSGIISQGRQLGRTIGFPTMNIVPNKNKLLPPGGVYETRVLYKGKEYKAISNVGCNPTVSDIDFIKVESHIILRSGAKDAVLMDGYGEFVTVSFVRYMREEKKFGSLDELKTTLELDRESVRKG